MLSLIAHSPAAVPEQRIRRFILDWSAILACMPVEYNAVPEPDDFDQQLRDLTSGQAEPARFTELSAAERARRAATPPPAQPGKRQWRKARKARQLRKPLGPQGRKQPGRGQAAPKRRGRPAYSARPKGTKRDRMIATARTTAVLIAFVVLLLVLHLLGFGPQ